MHSRQSIRCLSTQNKQLNPLTLFFIGNSVPITAINCQRNVVALDNLIVLNGEERNAGFVYLVQHELTATTISKQLYQQCHQKYIRRIDWILKMEEKTKIIISAKGIEIIANLWAYDFGIKYRYGY